MMRPRTWVWLVGLMLLATGLRLATMAIPYTPCADWHVYHQGGITMARYGTLGREIDGVSQGYRCFFPPGQLFALGMGYRLLGEHVWVGQLLNVLWSVPLVPGLWYLGRRMFSEKVGRAAALLGAVLPSTVFGCMVLGAEAPEAFWLVGALCVYVRWVEGRFHWAGALACGVMLGVGALIRPTYALLLAPMGLHMLLAWPGWRKAMAAGALVALGTALVVAPWTWRNYRVTGGFILISSNGGGNLWSANNELAEGAYTDQTWQWLYKNCPDDLSLQREGSARAKAWIAANPGRFALLAGVKLFRFWCNDMEIAWWALEQTHIDHPQLGIPRFWRDAGQGISQGFYILLAGAGTIGLWRGRRRWAQRREWMIIPVLCAYFTAIHMVFESQGKYHYMLVPLLCILAGLAFERPCDQPGGNPTQLKRVTAADTSLVG